MGTKNNPGAYDCYDKALPDEPMFVLLARDPFAPTVLRWWAAQREDDIDAHIRPESDNAMVQEARKCADEMESWRKVNNGAWRKPTE